LIEMVGDVPDARRKCEDLSRSLNSVFAIEHDVSLERLRGMSRKDAIAYLDRIDGLDAYVRARVRLYGLQQHAIPLDEAMWAYARKTEIVHPKCALEEAQAFLERRIPEAEAIEVVGLLEKQAWAEMGGLVRRGEVEKITSVPPDRTTRHMLRMVASGGSVSVGTPTAAESEAAQEEPSSPARSAASAKKSKPASRVRAASRKAPASKGRKKTVPKKTERPAKKAATRSRSAAKTKTTSSPKRAATRSGGGKSKPAARSGSGKAVRRKAASTASGGAGRSVRRSTKAKSA